MSILASTPSSDPFLRGKIGETVPVDRREECLLSSSDEECSVTPGPFMSSNDLMEKRKLLRILEEKIIKRGQQELEILSSLNVMTRGKRESLLCNN